jgi:hypothetical protein
MRLKLHYDTMLRNSAFNLNLRRCTEELSAAAAMDVLYAYVLAHQDDFDVRSVTHSLPLQPAVPQHHTTSTGRFWYVASRAER